MVPIFHHFIYIARLIWKKLLGLTILVAKYEHIKLTSDQRNPDSFVTLYTYIATTNMEITIQVTVRKL